MVQDKYGVQFFVRLLCSYLLSTSCDVILNENHYCCWRGLDMGKQPAWITMNVPRVSSMRIGEAHLRLPDFSALPTSHAQDVHCDPRRLFSHIQPLPATEFTPLENYVTQLAARAFSFVFGTPDVKKSPFIKKIMEGGEPCTPCL